MNGLVQVGVLQDGTPVFGQAAPQVFAAPQFVGAVAAPAAPAKPAKEKRAYTGRAGWRGVTVLSATELLALGVPQKTLDAIKGGEDLIVSDEARNRASLVDYIASEEDRKVFKGEYRLHRKSL